MAELTLQLRINPTTGKKDLLIKLRSDADALPQEHEQQHQALVDRLIHGGILKAGELGQIIIQRPEPQVEAAPVQAAPQTERRSAAAGESC